MAVGSSLTWTHCNVRYKVISGVNRRIHADATASARTEVRPCERAASMPWMPRDLERLHKGSSNILFSLPSSPWPGEATLCLVHFVVWAAIGGSLFVHTSRCCAGQFFSTQPFEDYFKVVATLITMTRTRASDWIPWYVDLENGRVQCLVYGEDFSKKNLRMLSHLRYIPSTGTRDNNVKLCKNMKPDILRAFHGCGGLAHAPLEPAESQHLQGSAESEEPICQGSQSSTMHASCGASQNLAAACRPIRNSSGTASQLQPSAGPSSARSLQQSTILVLHAKDQRCKCDMAWAELFYSTNIPFAAARSASFKKAVKMTSEMRTSYFPPSYHDIRKRLLNETKHKIKAQKVERTKMFIRTYGATLAGDDWSSANNHPFLNMMCISAAGEEFLGAIDTSGHMKDVVYIIDVIKRYLIEVGPENVV
jgi:hypothetical protein